MADSSSNELDSVSPSVAEFWDLYAGSDLVTLGRNRVVGYTGSYYVDEDDRPAAMIGEEKRFALSRKELLEFNYADEPLFDLGIYDELAAAISAIIHMPMMQDETTPFRDQLELVPRLLEQPVPGPETPYGTLRRQALMALENARISIEKSAALMEELMPGEEEYKAYQDAGMVSLLHAEREILLKAYAFCTTETQITKQITAVIDNHKYEDAITVQTAIWALGRHNDKAAIEYLLKLFRGSEFDFHRIVVQEALQFLFTGRELIPLTGDNEWRYWNDQAQRLPSTPAAWTAHDAESVFWEKRLRAAIYWKTAGEESRLEPLKEDEVLQVRLAAGGPERLDIQE